VGVDIEADKLGATMDALEGLAYPADVTDPEAAQRLVQQVHLAYNRIDILVNVAGGTLGAGRGIDDVTIEDWRRVVELNMSAPFYLAKAVAPIMKAQRSGRIISVGSGAGRSHSRSKVIPYAASKAGLMGLMRQLAVDLAPYGITCNTVSPGFILTERGQADWDRRTPEQQAEEMQTIAAGRLGQPHEIAAAIAFIASDEAGYIVGQTIMVDGGHWMF
jgi:3-oxoacyl-[acyl-carrier protein] reductase